MSTEFSVTKQNRNPSEGKEKKNIARKKKNWKEILKSKMLVKK